jgi:hypothetical protein
MPVERRKSPLNQHPDHDALVAELVRHLKAEPSLPAEPRIVEEEQRLSDSLHVVVYWTRWASVKEEERSAIILDAYEQALGKPQMLKITVAMGLTPMEAKQMGVDS